ncbi:MAG: MFS transporter [Streptosporangiaceae bacterium]|jgi:DHA2 family methylenomycin A resistance protein-like MFS transporter
MNRNLLGISIAYFMVLLDMTVLSVAEPSLAVSLHTSIAGLQWAVSGYTVAFGSLLLSSGAIADSHGAHRVFRVGVAAFGAGSLLSALAPNAGTLIALRVLLGVAAAACVPASMAMITRLYPEPARRGKAIATWAAISGSALAAGPVIGGLLVTTAGWRAIFVINVPVAAVTLALTAGPAVTCPRAGRRIDWPGQFAACAALGLLTDAVIAAGSGALVHATLSAAGTVLAVIFFLGSERRSDSPVLPPVILRAKGMAMALATGAVVNFTMTAALFVLPLIFSEWLGMDAAWTGLAFLPMTVPFAINPLITGKIVANYGPRPPLLAGLCLLAAAGALLGVAAAAHSGYLVMLPGLVAYGLGVSFALPALVTVVVTAAPTGMAGAASGLLNAIRQVGASPSVAVAGAFVSPSHGASALVFLLPAALCTLTAVVTVTRSM